MGALCIARRSVVDEPTQFRLEPDPAWWDRMRGSLREEGLRLLEPFAITLEGHAVGRRLLFRGSARGAVELVCGRCAEPYRLGFDETIELLLEPAPDATPIEGSLVLDPEEPGLGRYSGEELDFEPVLNEALWLSWPMQPFCREDCAGLCSRCGVNLNHESCRCARGDPASPFAALADLLESPSEPPVEPGEGADRTAGEAAGRRGGQDDPKRPGRSTGSTGRTGKNTE